MYDTVAEMALQNARWKLGAVAHYVDDETSNLVCGGMRQIIAEEKEKRYLCERLQKLGIHKNHAKKKLGIE